jgi:hypothetical protein
LVTVTGCGSSGARSLVGTSSMGARSFAKAIGIDIAIDLGVSFIGARIA